MCIFLVFDFTDKFLGGAHAHGCEYNVFLPTNIGSPQNKPPLPRGYISISDVRYFVRFSIFAVNLKLWFLMILVHDFWYFLIYDFFIIVTSLEFRTGNGGGRTLKKPWERFAGVKTNGLKCYYMDRFCPPGRVIERERNPPLLSIRGTERARTYEI